jgi:hypothetical protein
MRFRLVVVGALLSIVLMGAVASALWSASGTGSGRAVALNAQSVVVSATPGTQDLYPGSTGGAVYFTLTNPNPYAVTFTTMTAGTVTSSDQANCPASNVSVGNASGLSLPVAANTTSGTLSISNVTAMQLAAPNACQGITFTVSLTLSGSQT